MCPNCMKRFEDCSEGADINPPSLEDGRWSHSCMSQTRMTKCLRSDAQQTLPRILRWGTLDNSRMRKLQAKEARDGQRMAQTLSLPGGRAISYRKPS